MSKVIKLVIDNQKDRYLNSAEKLIFRFCKAHLIVDKQERVKQRGVIFSQMMDYYYQNY